MCSLLVLMQHLVELSCNFQKNYHQWNTFKRNIHKSNVQWEILYFEKKENESAGTFWVPVSIQPWANYSALCYALHWLPCSLTWLAWSLSIVRSWPTCVPLLFCLIMLYFNYSFITLFNLWLSILCYIHLGFWIWFNMYLKFDAIYPTWWMRRKLNAMDLD